MDFYRGEKYYFFFPSATVAIAEALAKAPDSYQGDNHPLQADG